MIDINNYLFNVLVRNCWTEFYLLQKVTAVGHDKNHFKDAFSRNDGTTHIQRTQK